MPCVKGVLSWIDHPTRDFQFDVVGTMPVLRDEDDFIGGGEGDDVDPRGAIDDDEWTLFTCLWVDGVLIVDGEDWICRSELAACDLPAQ